MYLKKGVTMVIDIPTGVYTMKVKRSVVKMNASKYRKVSKKKKSAILNDLVKTTHFHRKYLAMLINNKGKVYYTPQGDKLIGDPTIIYTYKRGRKKKYTKEKVLWLKACWVLSTYRSSIYLKVFIAKNQDWILPGIAQRVIEDFPKQIREDLQSLHNVPPAIQKKLRTISSATMDRLLKPVKDQEMVKHNYKSHSHVSVLKKQIPVEIHFDKTRGKLGYTELDTVHHCGMVTKGSYCCTLSEVEINTHWTELRALRNKAWVWIQKALTDIDESVPFCIHTRHSR